jgi:hypothetical protein
VVVHKASVEGEGATKPKDAISLITINTNNEKNKNKKW